MKLKCLIVDDEQLALDILEEYINRLDMLELVERCNNAMEAFNILQQQQIDLLFVDIQMPHLSGIELVRNLSHPPKIIFTTAYREYALDSYELNALDYLLKPISFDRFLRGVSKAFPQLPIKASNDAITPHEDRCDNQDTFVYIKSEKKMVRVFLKDILYIESLASYVQLYTQERKIICYKKISDFEDKLSKHQFLRVHRSFIISLNHVEAFTSSQIEIKGREIPIGRNYKNQVMQALFNQQSLKL